MKIRLGTVDDLKVMWRKETDIKVKLQELKSPDKETNFAMDR